MFASPLDTYEETLHGELTFDTLGTLENTALAKSEQIAAWMLVLKPGEFVDLKDDRRDKFKMHRFRAKLNLDRWEVDWVRTHFDGCRRLAAPGAHGGGQHGVRVDELEKFAFLIYGDLVEASSQYDNAVLRVCRTDAGDELISSIRYR